MCSVTSFFLYFFFKDRSRLVVTFFSKYCIQRDRRIYTIGIGKEGNGLPVFVFKKFPEYGMACWQRKLDIRSQYLIESNKLLHIGQNFFVLFFPLERNPMKCSFIQHFLWNFNSVHLLYLQIIYAFMKSGRCFNNK